MTTDDTDTTDYVAENSDASQPPEALDETPEHADDEDDDPDWRCAACGAPLSDAHDLATHDCDAED